MVTGDFQKLRYLIGGMHKLASAKFLADTNRALGKEALSLVRMGFETSTDPYGKRWERLKTRAGRPLLNTGRLLSSVKMNSSAAGFQLSSGLIYAGVHNLGRVIRPRSAPFLVFKVGNRLVFAKKVRIPQRRFIPSSQKLGGPWTNSLKRIAQQQVREVLRAAG